jgi:hypothetical protein
MALSPARIQAGFVRLLRRGELAIGAVRQRLSGERDVPVLTAGNAEEWAAFERRHRILLTRFRPLRDAINAMFTPRRRFENKSDLVILFLGRLCVEDFNEILLLSANGHGFGALKLLRGLYERVVTIRRLQLHPEEYEAFVAWGPVSMGKAAREALASFGEVLPEETLKKLERLIEEGNAERPRFMVTENADCDKCRKQRLSPSWTNLDFISMAKSVGDATGRWVLPCYIEPLRHAHATPGSLDARVDEVDGALVFNPGPNRTEADTALMLAHLLVLNVLDLFNDHFKPAGVEPHLKEALEVYQEAWGLKT